MNVSRLLKRLLLPVILFLIVLRHYLEVRNAPNEYDILLTKVVMIITSIAFLTVLFQEYRSWKAQRSEKDDLKLITPKQVIMFLLVIGYVIALKYIGFIVSTLLFMLVSFYFLKITNWKTYVLLPLCFTFIIYYSFVHLLNLKLPTGSLWSLM